MKAKLGHTYEVIVGNIGSVYRGANRFEANTKFNTYVELAALDLGRASGETVTMMKNDEPIHQVTGARDMENSDES